MFRQLESELVRTPGEATVRTVMTTICGSDVHDLHQHRDVESSVLGHEMIVEVIDDPSTTFAPGTLALAAPPIELCHGFTDYQSISAASLVAVPTGVPLRHAILAQQLGTVLFALERYRRAGADLSQTVAVFGQGSAGLLFVSLLARMGAESIIAVEPVDGRRVRSVAAGAHLAVTPSEYRRVLQAGELPEPRLVIEASGSDDARIQVIEAAAPQSVVGLFGLPPSWSEPAPVALGTAFMKSLSLCCTSNAQGEPGLWPFRRAMELIGSGEIDVSGWITHEFGLHDVSRAFDLVQHAPEEALKVLVLLADEFESTDTRG
jgi:L-iditol 2-dehydrogenase